MGGEEILLKCGGRYTIMEQVLQTYRICRRYPCQERVRNYNEKKQGG